VGIGVGSVAGLAAISKGNLSRRICPSDGACADADGVDANEAAKRLSTVSTVGFIAGSVGLVAGTLLLLTAPAASKARPPVSVAAAVAPGAAALVAVGTF
jgi:hypothetical protein